MITGSDYFRHYDNRYYYREIYAQKKRIND